MGTQKGLAGSRSSEGRFPKGPDTGEMISLLDSCNAFKIEGEKEAKIWHSKKAGNNTGYFHQVLGQEDKANSCGSTVVVYQGTEFLGRSQKEGQ